MTVQQIQADRCSFHSQKSLSQANGACPCQSASASNWRILLLPDPYLVNGCNKNVNNNNHSHSNNNSNNNKKKKKTIKNNNDIFSPTVFTLVFFCFFCCRCFNSSEIPQERRKQFLRLLACASFCHRGTKLLDGFNSLGQASNKMILIQMVQKL